MKPIQVKSALKIYDQLKATEVVFNPIANEALRAKNDHVETTEISMEKIKLIREYLTLILRRLNDVERG
jgi:hypothetical protein